MRWLMNKGPGVVLNDLIAFDKPYQMAYSGAPSNQAQMDRILQDLKNVVAPKIDRLHVIKTLDKACSGVIMFAKNPDAQKKYQDMIQKNQVEFEYRTIVKNVPQKLEACINIPLRRFTAGQDFEMRPLVKTTKDKVHYVKTNYDTIMTNNRDHCAYLRVNVTNEIPHQIRSHLGYGIGCPILGDKKYNHVGQKSPQTLSSGILSKFEMKPMAIPNPTKTIGKKLSKAEAEKLHDQLVVYHPAFRLSVRSAELAESFAKKVMFLEKNMWELSTLGGAYAAMSVYGSSFADKLMRISKAQYVVAKELGSDIYQSRSRIYIANALAMNGSVEKGLVVIGCEIKFLREELKDNFNLKMALAMGKLIKKIEKNQKKGSESR
ncbi:hypothetical protein FO519_005390 [Halicephalobus sp. NKZ332]|nr:hypothetical protein FO519_005390 [Halicephalobus sp. NKZ332]